MSAVPHEFVDFTPRSTESVAVVDPTDTSPEVMSQAIKARWYGSAAVREVQQRRLALENICDELAELTSPPAEVRCDQMWADFNDAKERGENEGGREALLKVAHSLADELESHQDAEKPRAGDDELHILARQVVATRHEEVAGMLRAEADDSQAIEGIVPDAWALKKAWGMVDAIAHDGQYKWTATFAERATGDPGFDNLAHRIAGALMRIPPNHYAADGRPRYPVLYWEIIAYMQNAAVAETNRRAEIAGRLAFAGQTPPSVISPAVGTTRKTPIITPPQEGQEAQVPPEPTPGIGRSGAAAAIRALRDGAGTVSGRITRTARPVLAPLRQRARAVAGMATAVPLGSRVMALGIPSFTAMWGNPHRSDRALPSWTRGIQNSR